jgi:hypothetical protein
MIGSCCTSTQAQLNESSMTWTMVGTGKSDVNDEEGWTLLPDGDLLTVDIANEPNSELFNPKTNSWSSAGNTPPNLVWNTEIGPQTLLPSGSVWVEGASGSTAFYNASTGAWTQGPTVPSFDGPGGVNRVADAPSTLLTDGSVMAVVSPSSLLSTPASYYVLNGNALTEIAGPPNAINDPSRDVRLLMLPTGQVLETDFTSDVEIYTGNGRVAPGIKPTVTSVPKMLTRGATYTIKGRRFNGVSQANMYGDDDQQATNYPLVRITNNATGHVFYCRTHDHSYMGVGSDRLVSTSFDVPLQIETGASSLVVVVNGVASAKVSVTVYGSSLTRSEAGVHIRLL